METGGGAVQLLLFVYAVAIVIALALIVGARADRFARRRLPLPDQSALVACAGALAALAFAPGEPPVPLLYVLGGLLAGFGAAWLLNRRLRGTDAFRIVYLVPMMIVPVVGDEVALARALRRLSDLLLKAAADDLSETTGSPVELTV